MAGGTRLRRAVALSAGQELSSSKMKCSSRRLKLFSWMKDVIAAVWMGVEVSVGMLTRAQPDADETTRLARVGTGKLRLKDEYDEGDKRLTVCQVE